MANNDHMYILDIRRNGESAGRAKVESKLSLGTSEECDVVFPDLKGRMNPTHLTFKLANQILSLYVVGDKSPTLLDDIALKSGKMFVLDHNDTIKIAGLEIIIRKVSKKEADELVSSPPGENTIIRLIDQNLDKEFGTAEDKANRKLEEINRKTQESKVKAKERQQEKKLAKEFELEINLTNDHEEKVSNSAKKKSISLKEFWQNLLSKFSKKEKATTNSKISSEAKAEIKSKKKADPPKTKGKGKAKSTKNTKINVASSFNYGLFKRLYALQIHAAFFYLIFYFIEPKYQVISILSSELSGLEPLYISLLGLIPFNLVSNPELIAAIQESLAWKNAHNFVLYIFIDIFINALLGASLPQLLLGIGTADNAIKKRILALMRSILHYFSLPLLLFHAPLLLRKRPLHEVITFSYLDNSGSKLRLFGPLILSPLIIILCFLGPSLTRPNIYQEVLVVDWPKPAGQVSPTGKKSIERSGAILPLDGYIDTSLYQEILPLPFMNQNNLAFMLINLDSQEVIEIERLPKFNFELMKENLATGFPLVQKIFPQTYATSNKDIVQEQNEIEKILSYSSSLSIHNAHLSLSVFGPFLSGPLMVRSQLMKLMPDRRFESLSKISLAQEQFLLFHEPEQDCFFPLYPKSIRGFCVRSIDKSQELYAYFIKNVLENLKFKEMPRANKDDFDIINISSLKEFETRLGELESFYETLAKRIIELNKENLEKVLLLSLESCIQFGKKNKIDVAKLELLKDKIMGHNL